MTKNIFTRPLRRASRTADVLGSVGSFVPLAVCFLVGALAGSLVAAGSPAADMSAYLVGVSSGAAGAEAFLKAFWNGISFLLLMLISATSLLGGAAAPMVAALRGYFLACTSASVIISCDGGLPAAAALVGIPALFTVPCMFLLGMDAMSGSARLIRLSLGRGGQYRAVPVLRHFFLCVPVILAGCAVELTLTPFLAGLMI